MNPPHKVMDFQPKELFLTNIPSYPRVSGVFCCGGQLRCSFDGMLSEWFRRMLSHEIKKTYWLFFIGIFMSSLTIYYISPTSNLDRVSMSSPPNKYPKNKPPPVGCGFFIATSRSQDAHLKTLRRWHQLLQLELTSQMFPFKMVILGGQNHSNKNSWPRNYWGNKAFLYNTWSFPITIEDGVFFWKCAKIMVFALPV